MRRRSKAAEAGYVLVTALIALAVMALLSAAAVRQASSAVRTAAQAVQSEQALYMANAGVEWALAAYQAGLVDLDRSSSHTNRLGLGESEGSYSVTVTPTADALRIRSTGYATRGGESASRVVEATIGRTDQVLRPPALVHATGTISLGNNAVVCGDLYAVGDVTLGSGTYVGTTGKCSEVLGTGTVVVGGALTRKGAEIQGGWCEGGTDQAGQPCSVNAPPTPTSIPTPPVGSEADCKALPDTSCSVEESSAAKPYELDGDDAYPSVVYVTGDMMVGRKSANTPVVIPGSVTFVVSGTVTFEEGIACTPATSCTVALFADHITDANQVEVYADLYANTATIKNGLEIHGDFLTSGALSIKNNLVAYGRIGSLTTLTIEQNAQVWGSLIGGDIDVGINAQLHPSPEDLQRYAEVGDGEYQVSPTSYSSWQ